jgi:REP element-mobilizing transposase RayT
MNNKSKYNPRIHNRRSIRLKGYDYSKEGLYFITFCCQNRANLFGEIITVGADLSVCPNEESRPSGLREENFLIEGGGRHEGLPQPGSNQSGGRPPCLPRPGKFGEMILNDAGKMIERWYYELENKFPYIKCHEMIVMPNHFHCILEIITVGADLSVCPNNGRHGGLPEQGGGRHGGLPQLGSSQPGSPQSGGKHEGLPQRELGSKLSSAIQWFKTMTTNEYIRGVKSLNWQSFDRRLWQRNYWEHIIRNEQAYDRISNYIKQNPSKWAEDQLFSKRKTK